MTMDHEKPVAELSLEELRAEYAILKRNAMYSTTEAEWNESVAEVAYRLSDGYDPEPAEWVQAARWTRTKCPRCNSTGIFGWGGSFGGIPARQGPCFRCDGTGFQGQDDYRRNYGHDRYSFERYDRTMATHQRMTLQNTDF